MSVKKNPPDVVPSRLKSRSPARRRKSGRRSRPDREFRPGSCRLNSKCKTVSRSQ